MKSVDGWDSGVKKALWRVTSHLIGRFSWHTQLFASVGRSQRLSASRHAQAVDTYDRTVRRILHCDLHKKGFIILWFIV